VLSGFNDTGPDNLQHAFAVAYVEPDEKHRQRIRDGELDACSIEADCLFEVDEHDNWFVQDVEKVDGVALANSRFERPGFERAGVVAIINELENNEMTREELKAAVLKEGLLNVLTAGDIAGAITQHPSEVFGTQRIQDDPVVARLVESAKGDEIEKRVKAEQKAADAEKRAAGLQQLANKAKVGDLLTDALKGDALKKLSDKERAAVQSAVARQTFDADDDEALKARVGEAVDAEVAKLDEYRKLYGAAGDEEGVDDAPPEDADSGSSTTKDPFLAGNALTAAGEAAPPKQRDAA